MSEVLQILNTIPEEDIARCAELTKAVDQSLKDQREREESEREAAREREQVAREEEAARQEKERQMQQQQALERQQQEKLEQEKQQNVSQTQTHVNDRRTALQPNSPPLPSTPSPSQAAQRTTSFKGLMRRSAIIDSDAIVKSEKGEKKGGKTSGRGEGGGEEGGGHGVTTKDSEFLVVDNGAHLAFHDHVSTAVAGGGSGTGESGSAQGSLSEGGGIGEGEKEGGAETYLSKYGSVRFADREQRARERSVTFEMDYSPMRESSGGVGQKEREEKVGNEKKEEKDKEGFPPSKVRSKKRDSLSHALSLTEAQIKSEIDKIMKETEEKVKGWKGEKEKS